MSTAPSQRRGLPQPCAVNRSSNGAAAAPINASENTALPAASQSDGHQQQQQQQSTRTNTYVFRKPTAALPQRPSTTTTTNTTTATATATSGAARALSYNTSGGESQNHTRNNNCNDKTPHRAEESSYTRPAAATFPWSSRPAPLPFDTAATAAAASSGNAGRTVMRPIHGDDNSSRYSYHYTNSSNYNNNSSGNDTTNSADASSFVDLSATPEQHRSRRGVSAAADEQPDRSNSSSNNHNHNTAYQQGQRQHASQYVDPAAENGTSASATQAPGSSLVFALSEDSELKVLASRVGPPSVTAGAPAAPPAALHRANHPAVSYAAPPRQPMPASAAAADVSGLHTYGGAQRGGSGSSQQQQQQQGPYASGVYGDGEAEDGSGASHGGVIKPSVQGAHYPTHSSSSAGNSSGSASALPQQHQQQQQQQQQQQAYGAAVSGKPTRSSSNVPLYRSHPHELPSPPALHVCPGGIPGTGVVAPIRDNSGNSTRWMANPIPSVSLYPASTQSSTSTAHRATTNSNNNNNNYNNNNSCVGGSSGGHGANTRSNVSSAAPESGCGGGGGGSIRSGHHATLSMDARSLHSNTPPPSTGASQPVEKNFTAAQREAVQQDVLQELYLNYTAVPIPAAMINRGDTDERRRRLEQRQKQIVYGKETEGYAKYTTLVPRLCDREYHNPLHALTPRPEYDCSKRQFDRVLNAWRRQLHQWDDCDLDHPDARFLPTGTATLLDLGLAEAPSCYTPPGSGAAGDVVTTPTDQDSALSPPLPPKAQPQQHQQQQKQASGVMHSIANVAAMAHDSNANDDDAVPEGQADDDEGVSHTRSPVFTGHTPTSALYSSGLSVHITSGRASAITAAACTPSRPQMSEGAEGPQVDDTFFLHMNSGNSRIASPFHATYSGTGHITNGNGAGPYYGYNNGNTYSNNNMNSSSSGAGNGGGGGGGVVTNGRGSANAYYQQFMRSHNGGTPGSTYAAHTGLTPAHRPPSRGNVPHHITAIFGREYELMTPSGPGSPSGLPHAARNGGSPYRLGEPWMPHRRSPTYAMGAAATGAQGPPTHPPTSSATPCNNNNNNNNSSGGAIATTASSNITAANSAGTMVMTTGQRGESPVHTTELALIPSTSQSSSGGFAQSPYGFRVHSPVQPQQQQQQSTPLTRSQSRPGGAGVAYPPSNSPSRSPIGLPPHQQPQPTQPQPQRERVAIATTMAAAARSRRGSGLGSAPTTWTPPNPQAQVRPSPHTPQLHLAATPPSTKRPDTQE